MRELNTSIGSIMEELSSIAELLYKQEKETAYPLLNQGLYNLSMLIDNIYKYGQEHAEYEFDVNKLMSALGEGLNAMESNDMTLLADILTFEIIEYLQTAKI